MFAVKNRNTNYAHIIKAVFINFPKNSHDVTSTKGQLSLSETETERHARKWTHTYTVHINNVVGLFLSQMQ